MRGVTLEAVLEDSSFHTSHSLSCYYPGRSVFLFATRKDMTDKSLRGDAVVV